MVKHYIQDISPQSDDSDEVPRPREVRPRTERSIRDFRPSPERVRLQTPPRTIERMEVPEEHSPRKKRRWGIWIAAIVAAFVLIAAGLLVVFPSTMITIVPHTHVITFDASTALTAYPSASATKGTIAYTVTTQAFEDSAVVQASGTEHVEEKATGTITVYNSYSDKSVRLIKNTRFQSPDGLIFRIPASVDVPGRKGATPGSINLTVFADQSGPKYNIGPTAKFTIPGLKSTPDMYTGVYGTSKQAFAGGFSGERPAVSPSILEVSKAEVRGRLNEKAQELARTVPEDSVAFPGLLAVSYESLPPTNEAGGGVRIHERATVTIPVFKLDTFAQSVAQAVSSDADGQTISIMFSDGTKAEAKGDFTPQDLGQAPITFSLTGRGQLVWSVNKQSLTEALAGRQESTFETIVKGFPAVEEAKARITPFWRHTFPEAQKIKVTVESPPAQF